MNINYIALTGRMRNGKTTVADVFVDRYGFRKLSFSSPIKEIGFLLGWDGTKSPIMRTLLQRTGDVVRGVFGEDVVIDSLFRKGGNSIPDMRIPHDTLCSEDFKNKFDKMIEGFALITSEILGKPTILSSEQRNRAHSALFDTNESGSLKIVVDDVRLLREADKLRASGYIIGKIIRPDLKVDPEFKEAQHPTEREVDQVDADFTIINNGSIEDLEKMAGATFDWLESEFKHGKKLTLRIGPSGTEEIRNAPTSPPPVENRCCDTR